MWLEKLSNADAIASNEQEVRDILVNELEGIADEISYDGLGSIIFKKTGQIDGPKIMLAGHMDEVGFMVRHITPMGQIIVVTIGGVKPSAQQMQEVRITTRDGKKIYGVLQSSLNDGKAENQYIDIGADTQQEVYALGIDVGDMVTYTTSFKSYDLNKKVCGKAFDDRLGCYVFGEVIKRLEGVSHPNIVYGVGTSSEEVGIRGAKTAAYEVNPDIVFALDVACYPDEFDRSYKNKRQIGKGMMITHNDRTLAPNRKMLYHVKDLAEKIGLEIQLDMFNNGGTDGGEAHKDRAGHPTLVCCLPVRYGHCAYSIADMQDVEDMINLFVELIKQLDRTNVEEFKRF